MIWLHFAGWFQCRLATDPDPHDEPRGVSGAAQACAGEPDLDRVIRFQPAGTVKRSHTPDVGVRVRAVVRDTEPVAAHPLLGAPVDLLEAPCFEGRNGIVAEDGSEPVVPFVIEIAQAGVRLERRHADVEAFPFSELQATGAQPALGAIAEETGIRDLAAVWRDRSTALAADLAASHDEVERAGLAKRIAVMRDTGLARFFGVRMLYAFALSGTSVIEDPLGRLADELDPARPWPIDFWLGGWDADAFQGYARGAVGVPLVSDPAPEQAVIPHLGRPSAALRA